MAQGRGNAGPALFAAIAILCLLLHCCMVHAATFTVGDSRGWTFNMINWPQGKQFRVGDVLVFNYNPRYHDVAVVNRIGYHICKKTPMGAPVLRSGNDQVELVKGWNFFICNVVGHCEAGMKIAVNAI